MKRPFLLVPIVVLAAAIVWRLSGPSSTDSHRPPLKSPASPPSVGAPTIGAAEPSPGPRVGGLRLRVTSEDKPVEGATATVTALDRRDNPHTITTLADGTQVLNRMPEGEYALLVLVAGHVPESRRFTVQSNQVTEVQIRLKKGAEIHGTVTDSKGHPLEGAATALLEPGSHRVVLEALATRTDAEGRYRISGIPSGTFEVDFRHPRHHPLRKEGVSIRDPDDRLTVDAALTSGTTLAGRVVDEESRPIDAARILALNEETSSAISGPDGRFVLYGLGESLLEVRAEASGYGIIFRSRVSPGTSDIELRLPRAGSISGRLEVTPLPDALAVKLWQYEADLGKELGQQYLARISASGDFVVPNLSPGQYRLEIEAAGYEALDRPTLTVEAGREIAHVIIRMRRKP